MDHLREALLADPGLPHDQQVDCAGGDSLGKAMDVLHRTVVSNGRSLARGCLGRGVFAPRSTSGAFGELVWASRVARIAGDAELRLETSLGKAFENALADQLGSRRMRPLQDDLVLAGTVQAHHVYQAEDVGENLLDHRLVDRRIAADAKHRELLFEAFGPNALLFQSRLKVAVRPDSPRRSP